jgi:hypothetical protein
MKVCVIARDNFVSAFSDIQWQLGTRYQKYSCVFFIVFHDYFTILEGKTVGL